MSEQTKIVKRSGIWVHWLAALGVFFMCDAVGAVSAAQKVTESIGQVSSTYANHIVWEISQGKKK